MTRHKATSTSNSGSNSGSGSGSSSGSTFDSRSPIERKRDFAAQIRQAIDRGGLGGGETSSTMTRSTRAPLLPPARPGPPPLLSPGRGQRNSAAEEARRVVREAITDMHNANTDPRRRAAIEASAATAVAHGQRAPRQSVFRNRDVQRRMDAAAEQLREMGLSYQARPQPDVDYSGTLSASGPRTQGGELFAVPNPFADMAYNIGDTAQIQVHPRLAPFIGLRGITPTMTVITTKSTSSDADAPSAIGAGTGPSGTAGADAANREHPSVTP